MPGIRRVLAVVSGVHLYTSGTLEKAQVNNKLKKGWRHPTPAAPTPAG